MRRFFLFAHNELRRDRATQEPSSQSHVYKSESATGVTVNDHIPKREPVRVMALARRFGEPLRKQYPVDETPVADEWTDLLDQADRRRGTHQDSND